MTRPPDVCKHVFVCSSCDWQVQAAPRARSDLGGAVPLFEAIALAHKDHVLEDHTEADQAAMRWQMDRLRPPSPTAPHRPGIVSGLLCGVPLPRWWVDK